MSPSIKVGLIGYGFSTKIFHLPYILPNPDLQVHAFLQRAEAPSGQVEAGKHCTVDYPDAKHYRTPEDFFADPEIDLVIVCTGHDTHASFAEQAMLAGKHVVVEKPFTITSAEADHLISTSKQRNRFLTCFQNRRYDSDFRTVRRFITEGSCGRIAEFAAHYDMDNPPWIHNNKDSAPKPGDGLLYGLGSHSIDQTLQLFGQPKSVTAFMRSLLTENGADDTFTLVLQYPEDGENRDLISTIKTTAVTPMPLHQMLKYQVRGTHGTFTKTGEDVQIEQFTESGMQVTDERFGVEPDKYHAFVTTISGSEDAKFGAAKGGEVHFTGTVKSQRGCYVDYYKDVVAALRGEKELVVKPEQSRDVIRLIELAKESAQKGITVPWS